MSSQDIETVSGGQEVPFLGEDQCNKSFCQSYCEIKGLTVSLLAAYTIAFSAIASTIFVAKMPTNNATDQLFRLDSVADIPAYFNTVLFIMLSPLIGVVAVSSNKQGAYKKAISEHKPEEDLIRLRNEISFVNKVGCIMAGILSIPAIAAYASSGQFFIAIGRNPVTARYSSDFLFPWSFAAFPVLLRIALEQSIFPAIDPRDVVIADCVFFAVATALAYIFSFGAVGIEPMGAQSIAWCYAVESWITLIFNVVYMNLHKELRVFEFIKFYGRKVGNARGVVKSILAQSIPAFINMSAEFSVSFVVVLMVGMISEVSQASLSYAMQLFNILLLLSTASGVAGSLKVGVSVGEGKIAEAKQFIFVSVISGLIFTGVPSVLVLAWPRGIIDIFSKLSVDVNSTEVLSANASNSTYIASTIEAENNIYARIMAFIVIFETLRYGLAALGKILGTPYAVSVLSCVSILSGLGLGAVLGFCTNLGATGVLLGWLVGILVADGFLIPHTMFLAKKEQLEKTSDRLKAPWCSDVKDMVNRCSFLKRSRTKSQSHNKSTTEAAQINLTEI